MVRAAGRFENKVHWIHLWFSVNIEVRGQGGRDHIIMQGFDYFVHVRYSLSFCGGSLRYPLATPLDFGGHLQSSFTGWLLV